MSQHEASQTKTSYKFWTVSENALSSQSWHRCCRENRSSCKTFFASGSSLVDNFGDECTQRSESFGRSSQAADGGLRLSQFFICEGNSLAVSYPHSELRRPSLRVIDALVQRIDSDECSRTVRIQLVGDRLSCEWTQNISSQYVSVGHQWYNNILLFVLIHHHSRKGGFLTNQGHSPGRFSVGS